MKLNVLIKAGKISQDITVPVGDGSQTFKWLALVAAHRLVTDGARNGRHLPRRSDRHSLPARTNLLPKDVYTADCPFLHPDDIVNEHVSDGDTVTVELYKEMEYDDYGSPMLSKWAIIAFRHHEQHQEKREMLIKEKRQEVESFLTESSERARLRKIEIEKPKIALMKKVMKKQAIDDALIQQTMNIEWGIIKDSGILDNIVPDQHQQEEIQRFFVRNYIELTDMYKFYSAVNSGGGTHTLEYIELCKFITETGILGEEHSNAILKVFIDSHIKGIGGRAASQKPSIHSEICMTEFFVALIRIAIYKNITCPKKEIAKLRRAGQYASNKKATMPTVPAALEAVYNDFILPVLKKMPAGSEMRDAIASEEVLLLLHENMDKLSKAFEQYATDYDSSSEEDSEESEDENVALGSMTCKQFGVFAADAGFLGGTEVIRRFSVLNIGRKSSFCGGKANNDVQVGVTQKDVRQIFAASQHDLDVTEEEYKAIYQGNHHHELMVFSEFLEGVCRMGVLKYGSIQDEPESKPELEKKLSHYDCIKLAVKRACSVVKE